MENNPMITGVGLVSPYGLGEASFKSAYNSRKKAFRTLSAFDCEEYTKKQAAQVPEYDAKEYLGRKGLRLMDRLTLHVSTAVELLHEQLGFADINARRAIVDDDSVSIVMGTSGPIQSIVDYDMETLEDPRFVQPGLFPNSVFNAAASHAAIRRSIRSSCVTVTNGLTSSLDAFEIAANQLQDGRTRMAFVGGAEELTNAYALGIQQISAETNCKAPILSEGAAFVCLENKIDSERRGAKHYAELMSISSLFCPDVELAYLENVKRIKDDIGENSFNEICCVFTSGKQSFDQLMVFDRSKPVISLYSKLGFLNSMSGVMSAIAAIYDVRIKIGEKVLINNVDPSGHCSSMVIKKVTSN